MSDIFVFRKFMTGEREGESHLYREAALEKLHTLHPGRRFTVYDDFTIVMRTDNGCDNGETYVIGLVDEEIPAMQNTATDEVTTFRIQ